MCGVTTGNAMVDAANWQGGKMPNPDNITDVLVVGGGLSGAALTWSLCQAGIKVVCLEQGGWVDPSDFPTNHLDYEVHRQSDWSPDPNVRKLPQDYPVNHLESDMVPVMYNAVGGSTIHWGGHSPRLHPSDFRVRTLDGVADDWPVSYQELEPYYDVSDRIMGLSGLNGDPANPPRPELPMPPVGIGTFGETLVKGFEKLGWSWWSAENAIASVPYDGRGSCNYCGPCDLGCIPKAKASADITYWPKAIQKGAILKTNVRVREITVNKEGRAQGAIFYDSNGVVHEQKAQVVVMACNGIGTPRLLLNSKSSLFPNGLANNSGLVGKNLMFHPSALVTGIFEEELDTQKGPHHTAIRSHEFYETDLSRGFVRGYSLLGARGFSGPVSIANGGPAGGRVPWGPRHHQAFRERFSHNANIVVLCEDLPEEHNQVVLDSELTDRSGIPIPRVKYRISENSYKILGHGIARAKEVMDAAGAQKGTIESKVHAEAWHLMGTARMGPDPGTSVVDRWGAAHDVPNLFVVDGSLFVTSAGINPTPTIQALALRTADYLKSEGRRLVTGKKA